MPSGFFRTSCSVRRSQDCSLFPDSPPKAAAFPVLTWPSCKNQVRVGLAGPLLLGRSQGPACRRPRQRGLAPGLQKGSCPAPAGVSHARTLLQSRTHGSRGSNTIASASSHYVLGMSFREAAATTTPISPKRRDISFYCTCSVFFCENVLFIYVYICATVQ